MTFHIESRMRTSDGFCGADSYLNPTDSVAAAILCQRLSLYISIGLEASSSTGALPDSILPAEVKQVSLPANAFEVQVNA